MKTDRSEAGAGARERIRQAHAGSDDLLVAGRAAGVNTTLDARSERATRYV